MRVGQHLRETYFTFDARSLAFFRIAFGCTLLLDLALRAWVVDYFYTNDGLIPNHTVLWAPPTRRLFSLFFTASTRAEALVGMTLCGLVFSCLVIGYRTRLMQFLTLICVTSLNTRIAVMENGGDIVVNQLCVWSLFLPLGRRFSVDAVLRSMRERHETTPAELADRVPLRTHDNRFRSLVVLALILQFFVIYLFNVLHKTGPTWMEGTAVHYTLHQDRIITTFGVWLRENAPVLALRLMTWSTLVIEGLGAALIISPFWVNRTRLLAFLLMPSLHLAFALCLNVGIFSYVMACYFPLLLRPVHWEWTYRFLERRHRARVCYYDADCGICLWCARLLTRLDLFSRIEFRDNSAELPDGVDAALVERTLVVVDEDGISTRHQAVARLLRSLPGGFLPAFVLTFPGLGRTFGWLYDRVADNRTRISAFFGMAVCGVPLAQPETTGPQSQTPVSRAWSRARLGLRELAVAVVLVAAVGEVLNVNSAVPRWMRYRQPTFLQAIIDYGRLIQSWRMFAPHAPMHDETITVEAKTVDGRIVDPYNEVASRIAPVPLDYVPARLGNDQFFCTYSLYLPQGGFRALYGAFEQWILRYHKRTGNPKDRIVSFKIYVVRDESPPIGETEPRNANRTEFLKYPQ